MTTEPEREEKAWALGIKGKSGAWLAARWDHEGTRYGFHPKLPKGGALPDGAVAARWHTYGECVRLKDSHPELWGSEIMPAEKTATPEPRRFVAVASAFGNEMFPEDACPICGRETAATDEFGQCADRKACDGAFAQAMLSMDAKAGEEA